MSFRHYVKLTLVFVWSTVSGCQNYFQQSGPDMNVCTTEAASGLNIEVKDQNTLSQITDALVTVTYSSRPAEVNSVDYQAYCSCYLTWEDPAGQATITVQKTGYSTKAVSVQIERDKCHVKSQKVDISLAP